MKIKETIERECCDVGKDLKIYKGKLPVGITVNEKIWFCVHCGQLWQYTRSPGDMDYGYEPLELKSPLMYTLNTTKNVMN